MTNRLLTRRLVNALGSPAATAEAFSDASTLRHMLRFEAALAQAAASAGLIPARVVPAIVAACDPALYDPPALAAAARRTATLTVPVKLSFGARRVGREPAKCKSMGFLLFDKVFYRAYFLEAA